MAGPANFAELHQRSQDNLINFLSTEVELARTLCKMAEASRDQYDRDRRLDSIRKVIEAIRHFEGRIADTSIRKNLDREASKLEAFLSSASAR